MKKNDWKDRLNTVEVRVKAGILSPVLTISPLSFCANDSSENNAATEFTFPLYPDPKREVTNKFASQYIPRSYLINKEGKVISATVGYQKDAKGRLGKFLKEVCLLNQEDIMDAKKTVREVLAAADPHQWQSGS